MPMLNVSGCSISLDHFLVDFSRRQGTIGDYRIMSDPTRFVFHYCSRYRVESPPFQPSRASLWQQPLKRQQMRDRAPACHFGSGTSWVGAQSPIGVNTKDNMFLAGGAAGMTEAVACHPLGTFNPLPPQPTLIAGTCQTPSKRVCSSHYQPGIKIVLDLVSRGQC